MNQTRSSIEEFLKDFSTRMPGVFSVQAPSAGPSDPDGLSRLEIEFEEGERLHRIAFAASATSGQAMIHSRYFIGTPDQVSQQAREWRKSLA